MTATLPLRLREVLRIARDARASDVHLAAGLPIKLRIDGALVKNDHPPLGSSDIDDIVSCCFTGQTVKMLETTGDATATCGDLHTGRSRIHAYRSGESYALACRLLALEVPTFESLYLPASLAQIVQRNSGLVIITGPTGSGKSTVLAAMADRINRTESKHIITIEDPIEYLHQSMKCLISQREIGRDAPSVSAALVGALRSDPDVLLVGEMRDRDTMHAALNAAETGHLVLCTMHTGCATESVDRIVGSFEGAAQTEVRTQLAESLAAVISLRLVPRARGTGRVAAIEILIGNDAARVAIRDSKTHQLRNVIATSRHCGMRTLESHLSELLLRGDVTYRSAHLAASRPDELRLPETAA